MALCNCCMFGHVHIILPLEDGNNEGWDLRSYKTGIR
jgi:hypothetical protein